MKRRSLSPRERIQMFEIQGGICACGCKRELGERFIAEHFTPVKMGNEAKPDCLLRYDCASAKTRRDIKAIAKVKRIRGETCTRRGRPIPSRPFPGHRKFDGTPVWRRT